MNISNTDQSSDDIFHPVLLTAAKEDTEEFRKYLSSKDIKMIHTPLEIYSMIKDNAGGFDALGKLETFENIVYGSKRNARFFLKQVKHHGKLEVARNRLNLAFNKATFDFLEQQGIAAVHPQDSEKAIDLVEVMLRLKRFGSTLYPCGTHKREEFPGLLEELDIPVTELDVFDLEGPSEDNLAIYRKKVDEALPQQIIFHSRRSVNRTLAAFPDLDYQEVTVISADKGITKKLNEKEIEVDKEAEGNWQSVLELVESL